MSDDKRWSLLPWKRLVCPKSQRRRVWVRRSMFQSPNSSSSAALPSHLTRLFPHFLVINRDWTDHQEHPGVQETWNWKSYLPWRLLHSTLPILPSHEENGICFVTELPTDGNDQVQPSTRMMGSQLQANRTRQLVILQADHPK